MKYYVYSHINPENKKPFYIGKGTGNRCYAQKDRSTAWKLYVKTLNNKGLAYSVEILHICNTEEDAFKLEQSEISKEFEKGNPLFNSLISEPRSFDVEAPISNANIEGAIPTFVRNSRRHADMTQMDLAIKAKTSQKYISALESGKPINDIGKLNNVLKIFGCILGIVKE